ncbi:MAG TPA: hypothetical protein VM619_02510 [Luteimonas sp.]|nr:hypothetical protein [Luteimonas sp.]
MTEDRVVMRDGQLIRMPAEELDALLQAAFITATWSALRQLGISDDDPAPTLDSVEALAGFGNDHITARVRLLDGREASASASIWPTTTRQN